MFGQQHMCCKLGVMYRTYWTLQGLHIVATEYLLVVAVPAACSMYNYKADSHSGPAAHVLVGHSSMSGQQHTLMCVPCDA
jgi:hypothetical protein